MLIKALILLGLIVAVAALLKRGKRTPSEPTSEGTQTASDTNDQEQPMKRCAQCGVHVPENETLSYQTLHFCCNEHKKTYLEDKAS